MHYLARNNEGATMVEFAFVAPILFTVLLGLTDFGYQMYVNSVVEGTVHQAARLATVGNKTPDQIDDFVKKQLSTFSSNGTITIKKTNYYQFSGIGKPEKLTVDLNGDGKWDPDPDPTDMVVGDCYEDLNNDGKWNSVAGRNGLGGSDDIVYYQVEFSYPRVVPMSGFLGWSNTVTTRAMTVMRNQPYASQQIPATLCTSS